MEYDSRRYYMPSNNMNSTSPNCTQLSEKEVDTSIHYTRDEIRTCSCQHRQQCNSPTHDGFFHLNDQPVKKIQDFVLPFNTYRLKPISQKTRNSIMTISENGSVSLEFLKIKNGEERVAEIFTVSGDGHELRIRHPSRQSETETTYEELGEKHWKKYHYAYKFVELVKSKTPKISMYTSDGKFMLMENSPENSFEANFCDGVKLILASTGITGKLVDGSELTGEKIMSSEVQFKLQIAHQMLHQCRTLESLLTSTSYNTFPIIIGKHPNNEVNTTIDSMSSSVSSDLTNTSSDRPMTMQELQGQTSSQVPEIFVPEVGWASKVSFKIISFQMH